MRVVRALHWCVAVLLVSAAGTFAALAQPASGYQPQVGQEGKDVVWVPTAQGLVDRMLDMAKAKPGDYVIDLGSGDGRTVITAALRGIKAHGIEYNPEMVDLAKRNAEKAGVGDKATFVKADIFESDFSRATVLTLFLLTKLNIKLRPTILEMKPGTRVVSNTFGMGEPDETAQAGPDCSSFCKAQLWIVPAKVEGTWRLGESELVLRQTYQMLSGKLQSGNVIAPLAAGRMMGDSISFEAGGGKYTGKVGGATMEGTRVQGGREEKWQATRTGD
jgi:hypothetical protein